MFIARRKTSDSNVLNENMPLQSCEIIAKTPAISKCKESFKNRASSINTFFIHIQERHFFWKPKERELALPWRSFFYRLEEMRSRGKSFLPECSCLGYVTGVALVAALPLRLPVLIPRPSGWATSSLAARPRATPSTWVAGTNQGWEIRRDALSPSPLYGQLTTTIGTPSTLWIPYPGVRPTSRRYVLYQHKSNDLATFKTRLRHSPGKFSFLHIFFWFTFNIIQSRIFFIVGETKYIWYNIIILLMYVLHQMLYTVNWKYLRNN